MHTHTQTIAIFYHIFETQAICSHLVFANCWTTESHSTFYIEIRTYIFNAYAHLYVSTHDFFTISLDSYFKPLPLAFISFQQFYLWKCFFFRSFFARRNRKCARFSNARVRVTKGKECWNLHEIQIYSKKFQQNLWNAKNGNYTWNWWNWLRWVSIKFIAKKKQNTLRRSELHRYQ